MSGNVLGIASCRPCRAARSILQYPVQLRMILSKEPVKRPGTQRPIFQKVVKAPVTGHRLKLPAIWEVGILACPRWHFKSKPSPSTSFGQQSDRPWSLFYPKDREMIIRHALEISYLKLLSRSLRSSVHSRPRLILGIYRSPAGAFRITLCL